MIFSTSRISVFHRKFSVMERYSKHCRKWDIHKTHVFYGSFLHFPAGIDTKYNLSYGIWYIWHGIALVHMPYLPGYVKFPKSRTLSLSLLQSPNVMLLSLIFTQIGCLTQLFESMKN